MATNQDEIRNQQFIDSQKLEKEEAGPYTGLKSREVTQTYKDFETQAGTFSEDVVDEFWLNWVGQSIENNFIYEYEGAEEFDENFNPFADDYLMGYERYKEKFINARNEQHADHIKSKIDRNQDRRDRLNASERNIMPALVGNLLNPENFVPLGLFGKGITFGSRFLKGGAVSGLSVGATEPFRRHYDPTATDEETMMYVGSAFLFGGLFNGFLGRAPTKLQDKKVIKETVDDKGGPDGLMNNIHKAQKETSGDNIWDGNLINVEKEFPTIKVVKVKENETGTFVDKNGDHIVTPDAKATNKINGSWIDKPETTKINIDKTTSKVKQYGTSNKAPVRIEQVDGETIAIVDTGYIKKLVENNKHMSSNKDTLSPHEIPQDIARHLKNEDEVAEYMVKKEIYRNTIVDAKKPKESFSQYERRLNDEVWNNVMKARTADYNTYYGEGGVATFLVRQLDKFYDMGKVGNALQKISPSVGNYLSKNMLELVGDMGVVSRAAKAGISLNSSVFARAMTRWGKTYDEWVVGFDDLYVKYATGQSDSTKVGSLNVTASRMRLGYNLKQIVDPSVAPANHDFGAFSEQVYKAVSDQDFYKSVDNPVIREAADHTRKFFKTFGDEAENLNMFASQKNLVNDIEVTEGYIKQIAKAIKENKLSSVAIERLKKLEGKFNKQLAKGKSQLEDLEDGVIRPFSDEFKETYITRYYSFEKISKNLDKFKQKIKTHIETNPAIYEKRLVNYKDTDALVDEITENILQQSARNDGDGLMAFGRTGGSYKAGARPLMERSLRIDSKEIQEFLETDLLAISKMYANRMGTAIEMTRSFGDRHMDKWFNKTEMDILLSGDIKKTSDITAMNKALGSMNAAKEKMYGTYNNKDITSIDKTSAQFLRNWTSLATMGRVVFTALADTGRPLMVHGIKRAFGDTFETMTTNRKAWTQMKADFDALYHAHELANQMGAMERFTTGIGPVSSNILQRSQGAWYWANGLTPWTLSIKRFTGIISQRRFMEDIIKYVDGSATKDEILRLNSYNIDLNTAKLIKSMPYQKDGKYILANTKAWSGKKGGGEALARLRVAVQMDVERTIITPSPADKLNMMYGVVDIPSESFKSIVRNNPVLQKFGFQEHQYGTKFQNAFMSIPFQFFSWMVSANRKLLMSGVTGRDFYLMQGAVGMVSFAMLGDYLKLASQNRGEMWWDKSLEEKIMTGVEKSGVLAIFSDVNGWVENATDNEYGIRPLFGMKDPYDPDNNKIRPHDKYRLLMGPAGSKFYDLYDSIASDDMTERSAKKAIYDLLPLNNLFYIDGTFKSIYNYSTDYYDER
jgi:hypothetical protein